MSKLIEAKQAKEFASTFFGDPVLKMAVNSAIDNCPGFDLVRCKDCKFTENMMPIENGSGCLLGDCTLRKEDDICVMVWGDDFCSYGERRTDGQHT